MYHSKLLFHFFKETQLDTLLSFQSLPWLYSLLYYLFHSYNSIYLISLRLSSSAVLCFLIHFAVFHAQFGSALACGLLKLGSGDELGN